MGIFRDFMKFNEKVLNTMVRNRNVLDQLPIKGKWNVKHYRKGLLIAEQNIENLITTVAKNNLFNTYFNALTQIAAADWCASIINNSGFTGYNAADTMASHAGWTEYTNYSEAARVPWGQGTAASAAISNASPMEFNISADGNVRGLFITSEDTKGGTTGVLWSAASYNSVIAVETGDQIRSTYSLSC